MCGVWCVSTTGFYDWRSRGISERARYDAVLVEQIVKMHKGHERNYGAMRVHPYLQDLSYSCSRRRINRLMKDHGISSNYHAHRRRRREPGEAPIFGNLLKDRAHVDSPGEVWAGDMTYLRTDEAAFYMAVVLDLCTRKVVGWTFSRSHDAELVRSALNLAIHNEQRHPNLIFHSDQGSEYRSDLYLEALAQSGITSSMSRSGTPTDNAYVESFFKTLKNELIHLFKFKTVIECAARIVDYLDFYNERRLHSGLNYLSPKQYQILQANCS